MFVVACCLLFVCFDGCLLIVDVVALDCWLLPHGLCAVQSYGSVAVRTRLGC